MNLCYVAQFILIFSSAVHSNFFSNDNNDDQGPTLVEKPHDPAADAKTVNHMFKDPNKHLDCLKLLASRTNAQRQAMKKSYIKTFNKTLGEGLYHFYKDHFRTFMFSARLMYTNVSILAREIRFSLNVSHHFKKDWGYMGIIVTQDGASLKAIADKYQRIFNTTIKDDLNRLMKTDAGKEVLGAILDAGVEKGRPSSGIDESKIESSFSVIPKKGDKCNLGKRKDLFDLLTGNSFEFLHKFVNDYKEKEGHSVEDHIIDHCDGEYEVREAYLRIVRYAMDQNLYYANDLHYGFQQYDEHVLDGVDRVMITRSEIDLHAINKAYKNQFNHDIMHSIKYHYDDKYGIYSNGLKTLLNQDEDKKNNSSS